MMARRRLAAMSENMLQALDRHAKQLFKMFEQK
jgi:hypothetical protein